MAEQRPTVLIVDDESGMRDLYVAFLDDEYDVITAGSGREAMELMDDSIDLVLLDRRMPGLYGDNVLEWIRDAGYECPIAMVTAVEPEVDTVELPFDDYLVKPVTREELTGLVETLLLRFEYGDVVREYFEVLSKVTLLDDREKATTLAESPEYAELLERLRAVKEEARVILDDAIANGQFETLFRSLAYD